MIDNDIKAKLFAIYVASGADPDSDNTFHCPVEDAFKYTKQAVEDLKKDYDEIGRNSG